MKIVTFNLRCDNDYDAENRWEFRKGLVLDKLDAEKPDAVGFQEVTPAMGDFLKRWMTEYLFVGCGRGAKYDGENNMIGIRRDRFELMNLETYWLSGTPDVPGSRYENQSECPRVCTHVILRTLDTNRLFHLYNTHLDHVSDEARVLGARALMEHMKRDLMRFDLPVILMGDMNAAPDSAPIKVFLTHPEVRLTCQTPDFPASWHDFGRKMEQPQIDYIFTKGFEAEREPVAWNDKPFGKYLSDHEALCAFLRLED